jgi:hypothetical protein
MMECVHCELLPEGQYHGHTLVALTTGTVAAAWFYVRAIDYAKHLSGKLQPGDGHIGDWEYRLTCGCLNDSPHVELMVLKAEGKEYIWKLTDQYDECPPAKRLGVWAD